MGVGGKDGTLNVVLLENQSCSTKYFLTHSQAELATGKWFKPQRTSKHSLWSFSIGCSIFYFLFSFWYFVYLLMFLEAPGIFCWTPWNWVTDGISWVSASLNPQARGSKHANSRGSQSQPLSHMCAKLWNAWKTHISDTCLNLHFQDPIYIQYVFLQHQTELLVQITVLSTLPARIKQSAEKAGCRQCCPGHSTTVV